MITYDPFWKTLKHSHENWYSLTKNHHISSSTMSRLKHNRPVSLQTVNDLCRILDCKVEDILLYTPSSEDQLL